MDFIYWELQFVRRNLWNLCEECGNPFFLKALNKFVVISFSLVLFEEVLDCFAKIFRLWMFTEENSGYTLMKHKFYSLSFS